jgi:hypothetical protein
LSRTAVHAAVKISWRICKRTAPGPIAAGAGVTAPASGAKAGGSVGRATSGASAEAGPCGGGVWPAQASKSADINTTQRAENRFMLTPF